MKISIINPFIILIALLIIGCEHEPDINDYQPESKLLVTPVSGNTTTIFQFDAGASFDQSIKENPVFIRWDWDSDGNWDKTFNTRTLESHRFYQKGIYTVVLEAATLLGKKDTTQYILNIEQGYSPPRPNLIVFPDTANIFTEFSFDASGTKDDEDSIAQLSFRWDFDGDYFWDTDFSNEYLQHHQYPKNRFYRCFVEVKDQQGMTEKTSFDIIVTLINDNLVPVIQYECNHCTLEDTIHFDAGQSYDMGTPNKQFTYSWDVYADKDWELEDSSSPLFTYHIPDEGIHEVKLRVTDQDGLYKDSIYLVEVFPINTPPHPVLVIGNRYGNPSTEFFMHARASWDREDSYMDIGVSWDLNDDGDWDTEYEKQMEVRAYFDQVGIYPVALKITDTYGKEEVAYDTIFVFQGNRQTGIIEVKGVESIPQYYGTVKIGSTWWMQHNSRYIPPPGSNASYSPDIYKGQTDSVHEYGYLYPYSALTDNFSPCPDGWRIPSLDDWNQLMSDLGPDLTISDLLLGGSSELHLRLTGYYQPGGYKMKGRIVNYYTTNTTTQGHPYLWYIDKLLKENRSVIGNKVYRLPIRCMKNE